MFKEITEQPINNTLSHNDKPMPSESIFDLMISGPVICIACSEDGSKIAIGDRNGTLTLSDNSGTVIWEKQIDEGIHGLAIIGNGNKVICGGKDCKLRMFNSLGSVEWEQTIGKSIWSLAVDPNGQFIVIGTGDSISLFTEGGLQVWEYPTNRAMVGTGLSRNGTTIMGCGDEHLYCLDNDGNLCWEKQRSDSLWDVSVDKEGDEIFIGGWDEKIHCLDREGNELWNYQTGGYVRAVDPLHDGGVIAGSHDNHVYHLSNTGELLGKFQADGEITCVCTSRQADIVIAGLSNKISGFNINPNAKPIEIPIEPTPIENTPNEIQERTEDDYEPMFGVGMFDEPIPDTTGIIARDEVTSNSHNTETEKNTNYNNYYNQTSYSNEGGEYKEFASEVVKGDVKNYLRLGNSAWIEKRLERAAEHYKRATEIDPDEPRAWHNLAICNYHLALKRNPENIRGAVQSAYASLEMAKEKGGTEYNAPDKTLAYFASQLGLDEE